MNQPAREQLQIAQAARSIALQMLEERGRGAGLVGVARVDAALESLLQAALVPAAGATDTFFQPDRPLGSFGARITLAAGLGLIEPEVEQALQTLRGVRNAFAHSTTTATLSDLGHADCRLRPTPPPAPMPSGRRWSGSCRSRAPGKAHPLIPPCGTTSC